MDKNFSLSQKHSIIIFSACLLMLLIYQLATINLYAFGDEKSFLQNVEVFIKNKNIIPVYTRYPTFYSYLITIPIYIVYACFLFIKHFPISALQDVVLFDFLFRESTHIWLKVSRFITMMFSLGTLFLLLKNCLERYRWGITLTVAALLVFDPFGVYFSNAIYGLPDVPVSFMATLSMFLCFKYLNVNQIKYLLFASFLAGLGTSMKINGMLMLFPLLSIVFIHRDSKHPRIKVLLIIILIFLAGFFIGSPVLLFSPNIYVEGFGYEMNMLTKSGWIGTGGTHWVWIPIRLWKLNPVMTMLFSFSFIYMLIKRKKEHLLYLILLLSACIILGALQKKTLQYFILLYPLAVFFAGEFLQNIWLSIPQQRIKRIAGVIFIICVIVFSCLETQKKLTGFNAVDNRVLAEQWMNNNLAHNSRLFTDEMYIPNIYVKNQMDKYLSMVNSSSSAYRNLILKYYFSRPAYRVDYLMDLGFQKEILMNDLADYIVVSSGDYARYIKEDETTLPNQKMPYYNKFMKARSFYLELLSGNHRYRLIKEFSGPQGPVISFYTKTDNQQKQTGSND